MITIPEDDNHPDCVFIEDTAVVVGKVACINRLGHISRRGEVGPVSEALNKLGYEIHTMTEPCCLDGGDVMWTGRELFVGLSSRTNEEGLAFLQSVFPSIPVHGVKFAKEESLHLKSVMSMCGENAIAVADTKAGHEAFEAIRSVSEVSYCPAPHPHSAFFCVSHVILCCLDAVFVQGNIYA